MTVPKGLRKGAQVLYLRPRRDIDGELERVNALRSELTEPADEVATDRTSRWCATCESWTSHTARTHREAIEKASGE